jgi:hypothetical protein
LDECPPVVMVCVWLALALPVEMECVCPVLALPTSTEWECELTVETLWLCEETG